MPWLAESSQKLSALLEKANVKHYRDSIRLYCPVCKASTNYVLDHDKQVYKCAGRTDWHNGNLMRLEGCGNVKTLDDGTGQHRDPQTP